MCLNQKNVPYSGSVMEDCLQTKSSFEQQIGFQPPSIATTIQTALYQCSDCILHKCADVWLKVRKTVSNLFFSFSFMCCVLCPANALPGKTTPFYFNLSIIMAMVFFPNRKCPTPTPPIIHCEITGSVEIKIGSEFLDFLFSSGLHLHPFGIHILCYKFLFHTQHPYLESISCLFCVNKMPPTPMAFLCPLNSLLFPAPMNLTWFCLENEQFMAFQVEN